MATMDVVATCALCHNRFAVSHIEALDEKQAEALLVPPGSYVCFWCWVSINTEPGQPFAWPYYGHA